MHKLISVIAVSLGLSTIAHADMIKIFNDNQNQNHLVVNFRECARPLRDHLNCIPGSSEIIIPAKQFATIDLYPAYFANITKIVEKDKSGNIVAQAVYDNDEEYGCRAFDAVTLKDEGNGFISCINREP